MKKIINWTIGSVFRTLGRILAYLLVGSLIAYLVSKNDIKLPTILGFEMVSAATIPLDNYDMIPQGQYYDCTASGCSTIGTTSDSYQTYNNEYAMFVNSSTVTIATNGVAFTYQPYETLKSGYLYNITTYYCSNKDLGSTTKTQFLGQASSSAISTNYSTTNSSTIADIGPFNYCYEIQSLISPKSNVRFISYKMTNSSSISGVYLYSIGFKIKELGIYTSEVQAIIESALNSATTGLATSNQLNNAVSSIEQTQNENTQQMIDNQNENTNNQIASQNVCQVYDNSTIRNIGYLGQDGQFVSQSDTSNNRTSNYIAVNTESSLKLYKQSQNSYRYCFYDKDSVMISCGFNGSLTEGQNITIPSNARFLRFTIHKTLGPQYEICSNGNQAISNSVNNLNDNLNNDDTSEATSEATDFFNDFTDNDHGLASIITAPLNSIQLMLSDSCVAPHTTFHGKTISLPCGSILWNRNGSNALKNFLNLIYGGLLSYYFIANLFSWINEFKNPDSDKIEVTNL